MKTIEEWKEKEKKAFKKKLDDQLKKFFTCPECGGEYSNWWTIEPEGEKERMVGVNYHCNADCINGVDSMESGHYGEGVFLKVKNVMKKKDPLKFEEQKETLF